MSKCIDMILWKNGLAVLFFYWNKAVKIRFYVNVEGDLYYFRVNREVYVFDKVLG